MLMFRMFTKRFFWPLLLVELVILTAVVPAASATSSSPLPVRVKVGILVLPDTPNIRSDYESLALRRCLATMGIPYDVLGDISQLEGYDLILAVGELHNTSLPFDERERLYGYVERGGVLLAYQVRGNQYYPLFGLMDHRHVVTRFRMGFESTDRDPALKYLNRPEEQEISLGDPDLFKEVISSTGYRLSTAQILGRFPDGWAAFARNEYGRGLAYVLSLNLTQTILLPQMALTHEAYRQWVNSFEPSSDVLFLILRGGSTRSLSDRAYAGIRYPMESKLPSSFLTTWMLVNRFGIPRNSPGWRSRRVSPAPSSSPQRILPTRPTSATIPEPTSNL